MKISEYKFMPEKPNTPELVKLFDRLLSYADFDPEGVYKLIYDHLPKIEQKPVAWSVFDKRTKKHYYTNESKYTAQHYANEHSHREADNTPSMVVVPLYTHPQPTAVEQVELKHEPLSYDELMRIVDGRESYFKIARAIEKAHGIGV